MSEAFDAPGSDEAVLPVTAVQLSDSEVSAAEDYAFLYPWQHEALDAWHAHGRRGVVEAVTGSGKTRLGVAAAHEAIRQGIKVLILVPTGELQRQWIATLNRDFPGASTGALGNGRSDSLDDVDVLVAIVHSAATRETLRAHKAGLLIADECHRYAAPLFAAALGDGYDWRLGLTATYERTDGGHEQVLSPYFGGVVFNLWYDRALEDDVIAPFDIALVGVDLTAAEQESYGSLSEIMANSARYLEQYASVPRSPFPAFIAAIAALASSVSLSPETGLARKYMKAMSARLSLLAETKTKGWALAALKIPVASSAGTLVFTQTQASARAAQDIYRSLGCSATAIFSGMKPEERKQGMVDFSNRDAQVLAAPRILDEGVDVPEADLGIIVAANRSQRQMVQRLGRVIRKKRDGRVGRLVVLYAHGTVEDPEVQGEEFLGRVLPHARRYEFFDVSTDISAIEDFLRYPEPVSTEATPPAVNSRELGELAKGKPQDQNPPSVTSPLFDLPLGDDEPPEVLTDFTGLTDDIVTDYLRRIGQFPLLNAEAEVDLGQAIEAGLMATHLLEYSQLSSRREFRDLIIVKRLGWQATEQMMNANLRLVVSLAKRYLGRGMEFMDVIAEGNQGLMRAIQKFDFTKGFKFSTYATWWIRQAITRAIADQARTIRLPVHLVEQVNSMVAETRQLAVTLDRQPTPAEVAVGMGVTLEKVTSLRLASAAVYSIDIDLPDGLGATEPMSNQLYDPSDLLAMDFVELREMREQIHATLDGLTEREASIIAMRYGLTDGEPKTLDEIGKVYDLTRERIRQIERAALVKLRHHSLSADLRVFAERPITDNALLTPEETESREFLESFSAS